MNVLLDDTSGKGSEIIADAIRRSASAGTGNAVTPSREKKEKVGKR
jgi:hypothetical protein